MVMSFNIPFLQNADNRVLSGIPVICHFILSGCLINVINEYKIYIIKSLLESVSQVAYNKDKGKELFKWNH